MNEFEWLSMNWSMNHNFRTDCEALEAGQTNERKRKHYRFGGYYGERSAEDIYLGPRWNHNSVSYPFNRSVRSKLQQKHRRFTSACLQNGKNYLQLGWYALLLWRHWSMTNFAIENYIMHLELIYSFKNHLKNDIL